ncbi:delta-aminolevulinic acid dehydratase [bacterium]|nr:delta-aminolevulinic acid dehydratase [candidate division CSSED10-310 bacterium]
MTPSVRNVLDDLEKYVRSENYRGYDPYDALNSPLMPVLTLGTRAGRIAWTQIMRRCPVNPRPLFRIRKTFNPKGLGLFLWGYAKLFSIQPDECYMDRIRHLMDLLETMKSPGCSGNGWGYNFDWQSRAFFIPKYTPTIVNSAFIGHALLDTHHRTGLNRALDLALPIRDFILKDLNRTEQGHCFCFSYTPLDTTAVHNANLLGASFLYRLSDRMNDSELRETALNSMMYSLNRQRDDGSWYYAESRYQRWIDSFHTGFNLQALRYFLDRNTVPDLEPAYRRGVSFYANSFFLDDGTPKYYCNRIYPIDIHSPAQAVVFFSGFDHEYSGLTDRILNWMIGHMRDPRGYFYFRYSPVLTNRIPYIRWNQAWVFHALTEYCLHRAETG